MTVTSSIDRTDIAVGHVADDASMHDVIATLRELHGAEYDFALEQWHGPSRLTAPPGRVIYLFVMDTAEATMPLRPGERVRGPAPGGPYQLAGSFAEVTAPCREALWPGDVVCVDAEAAEGVLLEGVGTAFRVDAEATAYPLPRLAMLRHLESRPGGCAAYPGAFRREALPPLRAPEGAADRRGPNRVNEHTLDMRSDRQPPPIKHYHGPVPCGHGHTVNHSETALVLPRAAYGLPLVDGSEEGEVFLYPRLAEDPAACFRVPVRPGSILVTPATEAGGVGHCFLNAFAMLVAIPGFVAPYQRMEEPT
jgi:hypothetical protein